MDQGFGFSHIEPYNKEGGYLMKKISMIVVFCMVLGLLFSSVAAQEPVKLILSDVTGDIGGRVTVSVAVGSDVELGGFQLLINYDPNF